MKRDKYRVEIDGLLDLSFKSVEPMEAEV